MTVSYNLDFSSNSIKSAFKTIFRWRGSVWKAIWKELLVWSGIYITIHICLHSDLLEDLNKGKRTHHRVRSDSFEDDKEFNQKFFTFSDFKRIGREINKRQEWIPLNFLLGFFVTQVITRWSKIFHNMGFIENIAHSVATVFRRKQETDAVLRRSIIRYVCLAQILVFRDLSRKVRRRFPSLDSIVTEGFMSHEEKRMIETAHSGSYNKYWMPMNWACSLCAQARDSNIITGDNYLVQLLEELKQFRTNLSVLCHYDWVPIPLVYPQLVILAVRTYFFLCLFSRQDYDDDNFIDFVIPIMTIMQYVFYLGWLKIAEILLNPMGEDDAHFELNELIDENLEVGMAIVDDTFNIVPPLIKESFAGLRRIEHPYFRGSATASIESPSTGDPSSKHSNRNIRMRRGPHSGNGNSVALVMGDNHEPSYVNGEIIENAANRSNAFQM